MPIASLKVRNFKSFKELDIRLDMFNILIGSNGSGKSNFVRVMQFMHDLHEYGLENAVSLQGGIEYLTNLNVDPSEGLSLEAHIELQEPWHFVTIWTDRGNRRFEVTLNEIVYRVCVQPRHNGGSFQLSEETLTHLYQFRLLGAHKKEQVTQGRTRFTNRQGKIVVNSLLPPGVSAKDFNYIPRQTLSQPLEPMQLIFQHPGYYQPKPFDGIFTYDFDPTAAQYAAIITGKVKLEADGSNLAIVLRKILEDPEKMRELCALLKDLLPSFKTLNVERLGDISLLIQVNETYLRRRFLPAVFISLGTINIIALVVALYFEASQSTIIEEPERNLHPSLISKILSMFRDASRGKQILVTTHNPELVRQADVKDLLLVTRDKAGFSKITRPSEKKEVRAFLKNEIGIQELYLQDLLDIG